MAETIIQKDAVQNLGESKPTSGNSDPNDSLPGQNLNLATRIKVDKSGTEESLDKVIQGYHLGKMFDKTQSNLHKTQAEMQKMAVEYKQTLEELNKIKQEQLVREQVSRLLPKQKPQSEEEEWPAEENEMKQIDPNEIVRQLSKVAEEPVKKVLSQLGLRDGENIPDINTLIENRIQQREAESEQKREAEGFIQQIRKQDAEDLRSKYGSVLSEDKITKMLDMLDMGITLQRRAEARYTDPETKPQAYDDYSGSRDLLYGMAEQLADAKILAVEKARQDEYDKQLSTGQFPGSDPSNSTPLAPTFDKQEQLRRRRLAVETMAKQADMIEAAKRARGVGR